ncbi:MAG: hypothetical protein C7B46_21050 [Sulfobacillus benefaciens]|uniref:Uncharacterized protein n=1 Tax=Sulfobacillus benefaciens TaxID=453960 RepID=A0A2T2WQG7_9FIRM|nr:MAG: hypothetical protein C7B46_21050 [Sulfobacillus benefaciens]
MGFRKRSLSHKFDESANHPSRHLPGLNVCRSLLTQAISDIFETIQTGNQGLTRSICWFDVVAKDGTE